jgi:hypothetical protein
MARISSQGSHEPMTPASIGHWRLRARKVSSGSYQAGSRPSLRRTAAIYPADSASGWQSHRPSSATPTFGCSMSPPLFSCRSCGGTRKAACCLGADRLLILVTHHLAAARNADAILVLDRGQLVGLGSHVTLLRQCSPYAALWSDYARSLEGERARADLSD